MKKSESRIEKYLVKKVKNKGGIAFKFISTGNAGVPDRIVLLPEGDIFFVELKVKGKKPTKIQEVIHHKIRNLGIDVYVIDDVESINCLIDRR